MFSYGAFHALNGDFFVGRGPFYDFYRFGGRRFDDPMTSCMGGSRLKRRSMRFNNSMLLGRPFRFSGPRRTESSRGVEHVDKNDVSLQWGRFISLLLVAWGSASAKIIPEKG